MKTPTRITFWYCCLAWLLAFPAAANAIWYTNQSGVTGGSPCAAYSSHVRGSTFTSMTAGQEYSIEAGRACGDVTCTGSSENLPFSYIATGDVIVRSTASATKTLTVVGYFGDACIPTGTWPNLTFPVGGCYIDTIYSGNINSNETKIVPFDLIDGGQPYNVYDYFFVTVKLSGVGVCVGEDFITSEHD